MPILLYAEFKTLLSETRLDAAFHMVSVGPALRMRMVLLSRKGASFTRKVGSLKIQGTMLCSCSLAHQPRVQWRHMYELKLQSRLVYTYEPKTTRRLLTRNGAARTLAPSNPRATVCRDRTTDIHTYYICT